MQQHNSTTLSFFFLHTLEFSRASVVTYFLSLIFLFSYFSIIMWQRAEAPGDYIDMQLLRYIVRVLVRAGCSAIRPRGGAHRVIAKCPYNECRRCCIDP